MNNSISSDATEDNQSLSAGLVKISMPLLELLGGALIAMVSGFYLYEAWQLPEPFNAKAVGAGEFPLIIGVVTLICALALTILGLLKLISKNTPEYASFPRLGYVVLAIVALIAVVSFMEVLGAFVSMAILSFMVMLAGGERRIGYLVSIPVVLGATIYVVFVLALGVYFP